MQNKTSIHAFHQNIASVVETLCKDGFILHVPPNPLNVNLDMNERIQTLKKHVASLDLNKVQKQTAIKTLHWSKSIGDKNQKVYVHLSFESSSLMKKEVLCNKVKCLVTDDPNNFASIKYRHSNLNNSERILKRIQAVSDDLMQVSDTDKREAKTRKKNALLIEEAAKNAFGEDAGISTVVGNWAVIVDYCGATIRIDTLTVDNNVDVTLFGLTRNISLVKARELIEAFLDN